MKILYAILILDLALLGWATAETNSLPPVPVEEFVWLDGSTGTVSYAAARIVQSEAPEGAMPPPTNIVLSAESEWELTFEWAPELGSTNVVVYPIKIQVPFEHDQGFVYVRAKKVAK